MTTPRQPLLHAEAVVLRAPSQSWSATDGMIGAGPIHGHYFSDVRVVRGLEVRVAGETPEHIATQQPSASEAVFVSLLRAIDDAEADPGVRGELSRTSTVRGVEEEFHIRSRLGETIETTVELRILPDLCGMDHVKAGLGAESAPAVSTTGTTAAWGDGTVSARLDLPGAELTLEGDAIVARWQVTVPAEGETSVGWSLAVTDASAVVAGVEGDLPWTVPAVTSGDERLTRWLAQALDDLDALRLTTTREPSLQFLAAGAPWFFTLFGRDSLWAARFLLPLGTRIAADTLRVLAGLQGAESVAATAEQPGKIMHELRRGALEIPGESISLPPLYYGTVDATALWVCLLHDAWRWGMPENEVRELAPHLVRALEWMRDSGDSDGDGLLEYVDETGHGLSNQGWKDSGDSVQWRDGSLADGPIALVEVQAYAYEAATHGADLLDALGLDGGDGWRAWAARLKQRFDESFWIDDPDGAYPAIALDATKRPVDTVTSNLGHLLGTGLLDVRQSALVARRLGSPQLDSGFGLRTMSTDSTGYWPLSYHGGSVWTHDTAIAILGLAREGHRDTATALTRGLLAAASAFDYRMPELHSGDSAAESTRPVPYPAACRPQAWSAAAAVAVLTSVLGLEPQGDALSLSPTDAVGAIDVDGLRLGDATVSVSVGGDGSVLRASGAPIEVR